MKTPLLFDENLKVTERKGIFLPYFSPSQFLCKVRERKALNMTLSGSVAMRDLPGAALIRIHRHLDTGKIGGIVRQKREKLLTNVDSPKNIVLLNDGTQ